MAKWAKVDASGKVVEIVEDDAKPDLEPGYDYRPATSQTKVGDNLGQPDQGQGAAGQRASDQGSQSQGQGNQPGTNPGHGGQAPGQASKPQPK